MSEVRKWVEVGGRKYEIIWDEDGKFRVWYTAMRFGKSYGPTNAVRPKGEWRFETLEAAEAAIAAHAKKAGPYKPTGRYAEKHGFAGKEAK